MKIEIYGKLNCSFCTAAKEVLDKNSIEYRYYLLDRDYTIMQLWEKVQFKTFPQIFINDEPIGGFSEMMRYFDGEE